MDVMPEIKFGVDTSSGTPAIVVESVKGIALKERVSHERLNEIVKQTGEAITQMLEEALRGAATIRGMIDKLSESEQQVANFIVEHSAWNFASSEQIPIFLFHPSMVPEELVILPDAENASEAYQKASGKSGWIKVKRGGKTTLVRKKKGE